MKTQDETIDSTPAEGADRRPPLPGIVVVFAGGSPAFRVLPLEKSRMVIGRSTGGPGSIADARLSREHFEVAFEGGTWTVKDLGSRNGTFVDGEAIDGARTFRAPRSVQAGETLALTAPDVRALAGSTVQSTEELVAGPSLQAALQRVARAAASSDRVLVTGETGTGKELASRRFHSTGPASSGPFVPVNCAAIPEGVAERLLFGARRGAFSGAVADAEGYVEAANHGVLFLDEVGELDLEVQAKLLRVIETHEVLPIGATAPRKVDVRFCFATHRDLRSAVANKSLREDLYYRIAQPEVHLPPLRDRTEEIPWLVERELSRLPGKLKAHVRLIDACVRRPWPGNVRELVASIRIAADAAQEAQAGLVRLEHLHSDAGLSLGPVKDESPATGAKTPGAEEIRRALDENAGNVSSAARALGLHRTQLYRLMKRLGITPPTTE